MTTMDMLAMPGADRRAKLQQMRKESRERTVMAANQMAQAAALASAKAKASRG